MRCANRSATVHVSPQQRVASGVSEGHVPPFGAAPHYVRAAAVRRRNATWNERSISWERVGEPVYHVVMAKRLARHAKLRLRGATELRSLADLIGATLAMLAVPCAAPLRAAAVRLMARVHRNERGTLVFTDETIEDMHARAVGDYYRCYGRLPSACHHGIAREATALIAADNSS